jgi:serine/threonine-protein kinase RsbT
MSPGHRASAISRGRPIEPGADPGTVAKVVIRTDSDVLAARQMGRALAQMLGLSSTDQTVVATMISELARNILLYAKPGTLSIGAAETNGRRGVVIVAKDRGPGIPDVERAMQLGYSTSNSLGLGLPGVSRLGDEFEIVSKVGKGTVVTVRKWKS